MPKFKMASRTPEEMRTAKDALNDTFAIVRNSNGTVNKKAVKELEENKWEIAELIVQLIQDEVTTTDPTPLLVDVVQGDIRNSYLWQEVTADLRVVSRAYGTKPLSQRMTFTEFSMSTSPKELAVSIPLEEIASGRTTPALVAEVMAEAINRYRIRAILDALDAGVPSATADRSGVGGYNLRYTGFTAANLDKAINGLNDEGDQPTIFGRHIYMFPAIQGFASWSDEILRDIQLRGVLGTYRGANVVSLRDKYSRRTGSHIIPNDRAYIYSGTKGAIFMQKDLSFLDYVVIDPRSSTFEVGTRFEDGLLVWDPYQYRIIED